MLGDRDAIVLGQGVSMPMRIIFDDLRHTAVPRNRRSQIRAGTHIEGCEACGVILYPYNGEE